MTDVFISYKREERDKARVLAELLVQRGLDVWWDVELLPGDRFQDEINAVLKKARVVVVLWTAEALDSNWVKGEASYALGRDVYVPAKLEPLDLLPVPFNTVQVADLSKWGGDTEHAALERFVGTLVKRLERQDSASNSRTNSKVKEVLNEPAVEVEFWRSVSDREHHSVEEYQSYLDKFGEKAAFAVLAKIRIEELSRVDSGPVVQQDAGRSDVPVDRGFEQDKQEEASDKAVDLTEKRAIGTEPRSGNQDAKNEIKSVDTNKLRWLIPVLAMAGVFGFGVWLATKPPKDYIPPDMVRIPAGEFMMGSNDGDEDEQPVREVSVNAFEMQRHELTWAEWEACEAGGGCREVERPWERFDNVRESERSTHPVVYVNVNDANDYINWINKKTRLNYRLPSEAEWEYAARAGSEDAYSWGPDIGEKQANCYGCKSQWDGQSTAPVGSFEANGFGVHDMHGNFWEWNADCWHSNYQGAPDDGSAWVDGCTTTNARPPRGGSWNGPPVNLRAANRVRDFSDNAIIAVGFRLARTLP